MEELATVDDVDLERFMGAWYVLGHIPPFLTRDAYNSVERYRHVGDGRVEVVFTFRKGGFDGERKVLRPTGFIDEEDPAQWGMRLVWPFKADYRIAWLSPDYDLTIVGRNKRDYVWIMGRNPIVEQTVYEDLVRQVGSMGYDQTEVRKVPQQPLAERDEPPEEMES